ncbi:dethiobiotin synthetase [Schizosaccharomyces cryophilus OY26]|uniref:Dethiobiotin synthetase n=1 Tax=Schizosaccharomyces cryophilus (strain OY26 / ATCC MYA-4695 / CBS 11777 / NBRC 106824 / NRRL Y48691) TaxID=653667 RepID=S9VTU5_SCHCR|nr:dethiobiotin synthetase [Schizosaccharomyces cryophilus OY26]EPY49589.1 dethiobiotin synthetase [Schizosaccharomyces cryophilus OY26]
MKLFVTGISTDVGKTIVSSILVESLQADYWKPIQSGDLENSDSHKLKRLISNSKTHIHPNSYALNTPASPHVAAKLDQVTIDVNSIVTPGTENPHMVIEGAGGVFVPLNDKDMIIDIIQQDYKVVIVSRNYLGSINHTLLTIEALRNRNISIAGIVFSGTENPETENWILQYSKLPCIGRVNEENYFDRSAISKYADLFRPNIMTL